MSFKVTAETPCNLCGDPIGKKMDAGHGLSWHTGDDGHAYHQTCADSMRIAELEAVIRAGLESYDVALRVFPEGSVARGVFQGAFLNWALDAKASLPE